VVAALPASSGATPSGEVKQAFSRLVKETGQLPTSVGKQRATLLKAARAANKKRKSPCSALVLVKRYQNHVKVLNGRAVIFPNAAPSSTAGMQVQLQNEGFFAGEAPVQGQ
jgi:hypothetical protein